MNRFRLALIFAAIIAFTAACGATKSVEVVDFSGVGESAESKGGEIRFDDLSDSVLSEAERGAAGQSKTFEANDNSKITVTWDKFGNKTEIRTFANHPRLASILLLTGANGFREAFIHGHDGKSVYASPELVEKVLNASADELANAAKIYQSFQPEFIYTQKQRESGTPLKPLPSSEFPVTNNQKIEPVPNEQTETETEQPAADEKKISEKGTTTQIADSSKTKNIEDF